MAYGMVHHLGTLGPETQRSLEDVINRLRDLDEQVVDDIILTGRQGADVSAVMATRESLFDQTTALEATIQTMDEEDAEAWRAKASEISQQYQTLLAQTRDMRQSTWTGARIEGLAWGVGAAAGAAALAYYVWFRKRRRRR